MLAGVLLQAVSGVVLPARPALPDALRHLDAASAAATAPAIVDAALGVCHAVPTASPLPESAAQLRELSQHFAFGDGLKQHLHEADLWDDALEALAAALLEPDAAAGAALAAEAAAASRRRRASCSCRRRSGGARSTRWRRRA